MINYPSLLLRKKNSLYPEGRTSYRFKKQLRRLVTVSGQSAFAPKKKKVKRLQKPSELDQPETDLPEDKDDGDDDDNDTNDQSNNNKDRKRDDSDD